MTEYEGPNKFSTRSTGMRTFRGKPGVTFGRQIGAYPILVGVPYRIPLETSSDIMVTGHGKRSITGVELGIDVNSATQHQLQAIPGISSKGAWRLLSTRAREIKEDSLFD